MSVTMTGWCRAIGAAACVLGVAACDDPLPPEMFYASTDLAVPRLADLATPPGEGGAGCLVRPSGLIHWWRGEMNANDSVGTDTGVWSSGEAYSGGEVGQAFSVLNANYIDAPLAYQGPMTVDVWTKAASVTQGTFSSVLATADVQVDPTFQFDMDGAGNFRVQAGVNTTDVTFGAVDTNSFQHLAMTYDGSTIMTYLNGVFVAQGSYGAGTLEFVKLKLGINRQGGSPYTGLIDEVHVFNRALSASEISQLHASAQYGLCTS